LEEVKDKDYRRWDTGKKNRKVMKREAPFTELSAVSEAEDLPGQVFSKMDIINDVLKPPDNIVEPNPKHKYFDWDLYKEECHKEPNATTLKQKLNETKIEGPVTAIECFKDVKDKGWKRLDTGKKNRKVNKLEAPFTELSAAVDIEEHPGQVFSKMDVINEVLKPPANIVQPNPKPKYVAWGVDRKERPQGANDANARKLAMDLNNQDLDNKKHGDVVSVKSFIASDKAEVDNTKDSNKVNGQDGVKDYKEEEEEDDDTTTCSCGLMKLFRSLFKKSKK